MTQEQPNDEPEAQPSTVPEVPGNENAPSRTAETKPQPEPLATGRSQASMSKTTSQSETKNARNGERISTNEDRVSGGSIKQSSSSKSISATVVGQSQHQPPLTFIR